MNVYIFYKSENPHFTKLDILLLRPKQNQKKNIKYMQAHN